MRLAWLATVVFLLVAATPFAAWAWHQQRGTTVQGVRVAGQRLPPTEDPVEALRERADAWLDREIGVRWNDVVVVRTRRQLGATIDLEALSAEILRVGRNGNPFDDLAEWWGAGRGEKDFAWPVSVTIPRTMFEELSLRIDREPIPARFGRDGRVLEPAQDGARLDVDASCSAIRHGILGEALMVELAVQEEEPPAPEPPPARELVVLGSWSTRISGSRARLHNVEVATASLDGAVIPAGGRLSFNERVGERSRGAGYQVAPVIVGGEMVDGIGGGTCQVASTLHAAGFVAGLDAPTHVPHSRPAGYVPLGLDATVVWPNVDLVMTNPNPFPVLVRSAVNGRRLRVDVLGTGPNAEVVWSRSVTTEDEPGERVIEDPEVPMGQALVTQDGIPGYLVIRRRELNRGHQRVSEERVLRYPPTDRIVRIPPIPPK